MTAASALLFANRTRTELSSFAAWPCLSKPPPRLTACKPRPSHHRLFQIWRHRLAELAAVFDMAITALHALAQLLIAVRGLGHKSDAQLRKPMVKTPDGAIAV